MSAKPYADCPFRYTSLRNAKRKAWDIADRAGTKPLPPVHCTDCDGWHVADATTTTAPTTGA